MFFAMTVRPEAAHSFGARIDQAIVFDRFNGQSQAWYRDSGQQRPRLDVQKPKVLIVSTKRWPIPARIALALANEGFLVAAISPFRSFISRTRAVHRRYVYRVWGRQDSIVQAIEDWAPDLLVCSDDPSVRELHWLYLRMAKGPRTEDASKLIKLIERSLGDPQGFEFAQKKSKLLPLAESLGVRCPPTVFTSGQNIDNALDASAYPVLVKADGSWGGRFVRIVENARQAGMAICEFQLPGRWPTTLKAFLARFIPMSIVRWNSRNLPAIGLQRFVPGCPANRAVVCWEGRVLAGVSVRVHKTVYTFGPASVVEVVDVPEMTEAANILVQHLKLSGMIGFDFVLDSANRAWFIEMNPRVTPVSYLGRSGGANLSAALFCQVMGADTSPKLSNVKEGRIALFPQELQRSPGSEFVSAGHDDVPWEDPELVLALLKSALRGGILKRLGMRRQNYQNSLIQNIQQPGPPDN